MGSELGYWANGQLGMDIKSESPIGRFRIGLLGYWSIGHGYFCGTQSFSRGDKKKGLRATQRIRSPDFVIKSSRFRATQNRSPKWFPAKGECPFFGPTQVASL